MSSNNILKRAIDNNGLKIRKLRKIVSKIEALEEVYSELTDEELQNETLRFREELSEGVSLDDLLPEAFAAIREADKRVLGIYPYPIQLMGGIVLHQGNLAEMRTGEGKTLTETMPVYLNALTGKGVHVVTVNEYLSQRDAEEMGQVFRWMGLTVGQNGANLTPVQKKEAYACDITYSTNDELAFDYLRDNMAVYKDDECQRGLNYAIVDEVDSILIDEARTPLIISGNAKSLKNLYMMADKFAKSISRSDYSYDVETKTVSLLPEGIEKANKFFGIDNLYDVESFTYAHYVDAALKANYTMELDKDYIVKDGEVYIVDQFTGRVMEGRRFSDGLHQALEAKEHVEIKNANRTEASITYQNFFRMYTKLSGMSGTASTEEKEFYETYHMDVVVIPTNKPIQREDLDDVLFATLDAKLRAVVNKIVEVHQTGQPILVGTASVESSEQISNMLTIKGINHSVLNAKNDSKEATIIAMAGQKGAVTVATNMAGRGTDIKLGPQVRDLGGLFVLGTERHESRRIDNQLRGRSGRQGDPGLTQFYISLDDELVQRFGSERMKKIQKQLIDKGKEDEPIQSRLISKSVINAQKQVEGNNFDERKNTLQYDDVMRKERDEIYSQRQLVIGFEDDINPYILAMIWRTLDYKVDLYLQDNGKEKKRNWEGLVQFAGATLNIIITDEDLYTLQDMSNQEVKEWLYGKSVDMVKAKKDALALPEQLQDLEKYCILKAVDFNWTNNIDNMEQLRMSITLRGYGQYNPIVEYQKSAYVMYEKMIASIEEDVARWFMHSKIVRSDRSES